MFKDLTPENWREHCLPVYKRYIPWAVIQKYKDLDNQKKNSGLTKPLHEHVDACVAFVDISGFTKLSEKLAKTYGSQASEMLNKYISGYFVCLVDVVQHFRGDILKFAGDAMLVMWKASDHQRNTFKRDLSFRASACMITLMKVLNGLPIIDGLSLKLHCGIGAGKLSELFVGGEQGHWEYFVGGMPIKGMSDAGDIAESGEAIVSPNCWKTLNRFRVGYESKQMEEHPLITATEKVHDGVTYYVLQQINTKEMELEADPYNMLSTELYNSLTHSLRDYLKNYNREGGVQQDIELPRKLATRIQEQSPIPDIPMRFAERLSGFLPSFYLKRLEKSIDPHTNKRALQEMFESTKEEYRNVYILFVFLPGLKYDPPEFKDSYDPDVLLRLHAAVRVVQQHTFEHKGYVARLLADDKGTRFKLVFGMPTMTFDDNGQRAVLCATKILQGLRSCEFKRDAKLDMRTSIGLATGRVYCGEAGSSKRCEYTAVGYKVIMAARLMGIAKKKLSGGILTEAPVYEEVKVSQQFLKQVVFNQYTAQRMKGIADPVPVYSVAPNVFGRAGQSLSAHQRVVGQSSRDLSDRKFQYGVQISRRGGSSVSSLMFGNKTRTVKMMNKPPPIFGRDKEMKAIKDILDNLNVVDEKEDIYEQKTPVGHVSDKKKGGFFSKFGWGKKKKEPQKRLEKPQPRHRKKLSKQKAYGTMIGSLKMKTDTSAMQAGLHRSRVILVLGESGMGKSSILRHSRYHAQSVIVVNKETGKKVPIKTYYSAALAVNNSIPFAPWKRIILDMMEFEENFVSGDVSSILTQRQSKILSMLSPSFHPYVSVLNQVLETDFQTNEKVNILTAAARANYVQQILIDLLKYVTTKRYPVFLVLSELHNMDENSWRLLYHVCGQVSNLAVLLTTRELTSDKPNFTQFMDILRAANKTFALENLKKEDAANLLMSQYELSTLPKVIESFIWHKCEGHPLYSREIMKSLIQNGYVHIQSTKKGNKCVVTNFDLSAIEKTIPDSVQSLIVSQIDHLDGDQQLMLRVLSTIDLPHMDVSLVLQAHPIRTLSEQACGRILETLRSLGYLVLTDKISEGKDSSVHYYAIAKKVVREACYSSTLQAQRFDIHRNIANHFLESYNRSAGAEKSTYYNVLALHWDHAGPEFDPVVFTQAIRFNYFAATQSFENNACEDAVKFFLRARDRYAIAKAKKISIKMPESRINEIAVFNGLGNSYQQLGRYQQSIDTWRGLLQLYGIQIPAKLTKDLNKYLKIIQKNVHKYGKISQKEENIFKHPNLTQQIINAFMHISRVYDNICSAALFDGQIQLATYAAFLMLDYSRKIDLTTLMALAMSHLALLLQLQGMTRESNCLFSESDRLMRIKSSHLPKNLSYNLSGNERKRDNAETYLSVAVCHASQGKWDKSLPPLRKATQHFQGLKEWRLFREALMTNAIINHFSGNFRECKADLERALESCSENSMDNHFFFQILVWQIYTELVENGPSLDKTSNDSEYALLGTELEQNQEEGGRKNRKRESYLSSKSIELLLTEAEGYLQTRTSRNRRIREESKIVGRSISDAIYLDRFKLDVLKGYTQLQRNFAQLHVHGNLNPRQLSQPKQQLYVFKLVAMAQEFLSCIGCDQDTKRIDEVIDCADLLWYDVYPYFYCMVACCDLYDCLTSPIAEKFVKESPGIQIFCRTLKHIAETFVKKKLEKSRFLFAKPFALFTNARLLMSKNHSPQAMSTLSKNKALFSENLVVLKDWYPSWHTAALNNNPHAIHQWKWYQRQHNKKKEREIMQLRENYEQVRIDNDKLRKEVARLQQANVSSQKIAPKADATMKDEWDRMKQQLAVWGEVLEKKDQEIKSLTIQNEDLRDMKFDGPRGVFTDSQVNYLQSNGTRGERPPVSKKDEFMRRYGIEIGELTQLYNALHKLVPE